MIWEIHHLIFATVISLIGAWLLLHFGVKPWAQEEEVKTQPKPQPLALPAQKPTKVLPEPEIFYPQPEERPQSKRQMWEEKTFEIVLGTWSESTGNAGGVDDGQYDIKVLEPKWFNSYVIFKMQLSSRLPTPQVESFVTGPYTLALRAAFAKHTKQTVKAERVSASLAFGEVAVTVPSPLKPPSMHITKMVQYAKPAVPVQDRTGEKDLHGLIGANTEDKLQYIDFAMTPVALFVGQTRGGKTANLMAMLIGLLQSKPERLELYIAATDMYQWMGFENAPHTKAMEDTGAGIAAMLQDLVRKSQQAADRKSDRTHPSRIVVIDDLSAIAKFAEWNDIRDALVHITSSGGKNNVYTCITTHRVTEQNGVGSGGRGIALAAGARIGTYTSGGQSMLAEHLGVSQRQAESIPMPRAKQEAAISFNGEYPQIIKTVYVNWKEVAGILKQGVNQSVNNQWEEVEGWPIRATPPKSSRVEGYTTPYTIVPAYTPSTPPLTPSDFNGYVNAATKKEVRERDGCMCQWCFGEGTEDCGPDTYPWEFDHFVPKSRGGPDTADNIVLSCRTCNRQKSDMPPGDFIKKRLLELDGDVPVINLVDGQYSVSAWDAVRMYYANEHSKKSVSWIATRALGRKGGVQNESVKTFIEAGRKAFALLRELHNV